ncbi:MAG: hypothetical protein A2V64_09390 [Bacteroidetes bacterium RBG_13_43_22]|nr:MAG: hypothetical protein A2V64_09390 [Bacteroidetes bacterium RBG_13_43_22]
MVKTLALSIWFVFHPVHVTLTSIDHIQDTDSLKVFVRMYYDDFLLDYSLSGLTSTGEDFLNSNKFPEDLMNNYMNEKVNIIVNNKPLKGKLLNLDLENNEISMNILYRTDKKPRIITVRNLIMTGLYSDQANMTIIRVNDFEEGVMLTPLKTEQTFSLK